MLTVAVFELAPDVDGDGVNKVTYVIQWNKTEPGSCRVSNWRSFPIFPSSATGMNELICFTPV